MYNDQSLCLLIFPFVEKYGLLNDFIAFLQVWFVDREVPVVDGGAVGAAVRGVLHRDAHVEHRVGRLRAVDAHRLAGEGFENLNQVGICVTARAFRQITQTRKQWKWQSWASCSKESLA